MILSDLLKAGILLLVHQVVYACTTQLSRDISPPLDHCLQLLFLPYDLECRNLWQNQRMPEGWLYRTRCPTQTWSALIGMQLVLLTQIGSVYTDGTFQYRGEGGGGGSEREKLLLAWDNFLQSQEIEVEYSMSSTDDITKN